MLAPASSSVPLRLTFFWGGGGGPAPPWFCPYLAKPLMFLFVVVVVPCCCCCSCLLVPVGGLFVCVCGGCVQDLGLSAGPPFPWTAQNFRSFFAPSRRKFLCFSLGGLLVEHWWLKAGNLKCTETPAASGPPGLAHDSQRTPNAHISAPRRFKHHQNSTRKPPEREKRMKFPVGER